MGTISRNHDKKHILYWKSLSLGNGKVTAHGQTAIDQKLSKRIQFKQ